MKRFWVGLLLVLGGSACSLSTNQQKANGLRIRWVRDPENLSPLVQPNQNALDALSLLHCSLLQVNFSTNTYSPALAESLPLVHLVGDSLMELRYDLRRAATWDNGHPILASDVAFSLKLYQCPGLPNEKTRAQLSFIRAIKLDASDPRRFTLVCRGQAPEYTFESGEFPVLPEATLDPKHTLRHYPLDSLSKLLGLATPDTPLARLVRRYQHADPSHHPERLPGCGAYQLKSWEIDRQLVFTRKRHWWADKLRPAPFMLQARSPELRFLIIPDETAATLALRRHELDVLPQLSARVFQRLQAADASQREIAFYSTPSYELVTAGFNTRQSILRDSLTRQALACLFDPVKLLKATQLGQGLRTVGLVPPQSRLFYNDSLPLLAYAPQRVAPLLQQAGWQRQAAGWVRAQTPKRSEQLALTIRYRADEASFATIALQFKAAAAKLDIPVSLLPTEPSSLTTALREGNFDIYVRKLSGNPFAFNFTTLLHSRTIPESNLTKFSTPATDQLIDAISAAGDADRKRRMLRRFQLVMQEQMPLVPLFFLPYRLAAARDIEHLYPSGLKPGYYAAAALRNPTSSVAATKP